MPQQDKHRMTAQEALEKLVAGNHRFVDGRQRHPNQAPQRRTELKAGEHPFAAILACSDSRVGPELIFDQGLGDLFVIHVAGNALDDLVLGSIEHAAAHLHVPLVMVLGHSDCGAIGAAAAGGQAEGHIRHVIQSVNPALEQFRDQSGVMLNHAAKAGAKSTAERLRASEPILAPLVAGGQLQVKAGYYNLSTGAVEILA